MLGTIALEVAETDGRAPLPPEHERIAGRRSGLTAINATAWPKTAAAANVMAGWISTAQFNRQR